MSFLMEKYSKVGWSLVREKRTTRRMKIQLMSWLFCPTSYDGMPCRQSGQRHRRRRGVRRRSPSRGGLFMFGDPSIMAL